MDDTSIQKDDEQLLQDAVIKYIKAASLMNEGVETEKESKEFYWQWGLAAAMVARHSGEPCDFHAAISQYRKAQQLGLNEDGFFADFGGVLFDCALLTNNDELVSEAITLYQDSVVIDFASIDREDVEKCEKMAKRYLNLAKCYQYLLRATAEQKYVELASAYFEQSSQLQPDTVEVWFEWGSAVYFFAKASCTALYLYEAVEKFTRALQLAPNQVHVIAGYCEALAQLAIHEDDLEMLQKAQFQISQAISELPHSLQLIVSYSSVHVQLGRYFEDKRYLLLAIHEIEKGLNIEFGNSSLQHQLALAKFSLGELTEDTTILEESLKNFEITAKSDIGRFGYFWNEWGVTYLSIAAVTSEKRYLEEARQKFERSVVLHDYIAPEWLFNYGCTLNFIADSTDDEVCYEKAIQALQAALVMSPDYTLIRFHLAVAYAHFADLTEDTELFQEASRQFTVVLKEDPEEDMAWFEFGLALLQFSQLVTDAHLGDMKQNLIEQAEHHSLQALSLGNESANYNLACLYALQGNYTGAVHYLDKAFEADTLPPREVLIRDEWLTNLHDTPYFQSLLHELQQEEDT